MIEHRGRVTKRLAVPLMAMGTMTGGVLALTATPAYAAMAAYTCGYQANVNIFNSGYKLKGCVNTDGDANSSSPSLTGTGANTVNDTSGAKAVFSGVATIFSSPYTPSDTLNNSGLLKVERSIGANQGWVAARAETVGPTPFFTWSSGYEYAWAEPAKPGGTTTHNNTNNEQPQQMNGDQTTANSPGYAWAQCTAYSGGTETAHVTIMNGVVDTHIIKDGTMAGYPSESVAVPTSPPANYRVNYWIENVNDYGYIVFNEQIPNADGSLTVNAAHMYMQGNSAYGDLIIAQTKCGQ